MLVNRSWVLVWAGRDVARCLPASFGVMLFPDFAHTKPGELIKTRFRIEASWEWCPTILRWAVHPTPTPAGVIDSADWTGRYPPKRRTFGFRWAMGASGNIGSWHWSGPKERRW